MLKLDYEIDVIRREFVVAGIEDSAISVAEILELKNSRRAGNLFSGRSPWTTIELEKVESYLNLPNGFISNEARMMFEDSRRRELIDVEAARVVAANDLGASLAINVWNLANDPKLLAIVIDEQITNPGDIDSTSALKIYNDETIQTAVRIALRKLGHELQLTFPERPKLENSELLK